MECDSCLGTGGRGVWSPKGKNRTWRDEEVTYCSCWFLLRYGNSMKPLVPNPKFVVVAGQLSMGSWLKRLLPWVVVFKSDFYKLLKYIPALHLSRRHATCKNLCDFYCVNLSYKCIFVHRFYFDQEILYWFSFDKFSYNRKLIDLVTPYSLFLWRRIIWPCFLLIICSHPNIQQATFSMVSWSQFLGQMIWLTEPLIWTSK